ncbi:MAG: aconitase X catalytic domain-containing protein [Chloroflexota bacterium]
MSKLRLTPEEADMLHGGLGEGLAMAMRIVTKLAQAVGAESLLPISRAHIDSCLYHGQAGLDFVEQLARFRVQVAVPTTLNVGALDLLHPDLFRGDAKTRASARRLMDAYVSLGCRPTWTCAPYQLQERPRFGEHVAWGESNAIVFANSVLGARTERYGDFIDICAALTRSVPRAGLHMCQNRRGEIVFDISHLRADLLRADVFFPVLGYCIGLDAGNRIPVIVGLPPDTSEDQLKALGATAASSGGVALFHAVGITPEAPTINAAVQGHDNVPVVKVNIDRLRAARNTLTTTNKAGKIDAVSVGTPHFSLHEFCSLVQLIERLSLQSRVDFYVSTHRAVFEEAQAHGWIEQCKQAGISVIVDTCTYVTPILKPGVKVVMTNSGKWAYYAPGNLNVETVYGSLEECVQSAAAGRVIRSEWL